MPYTPPVTRKESRRGDNTYHFYVDANKERIPGVTTILNGGIPKPQLIDWAGNKSAELAVDNWELLSDLKPLARLQWIKDARYTSDNQVKNKGTRVHAIAEHVVAGHPAEFADAEEEALLRPYIENYIRFIDDFELDAEFVEAVVVNYTHGYAGTLDLIATITNPQSGEREPWLLDIKTGEKGIWRETAFQLAAYRNAEIYVDDQGVEQPMPAIDPDHCAAINVTADKADLIPVVADDQAYKIFRHAKVIYSTDKDGWVGTPIKPPKTSAAVINWDDDEAVARSTPA